MRRRSLILLFTVGLLLASGSTFVLAEEGVKGRDPTVLQEVADLKTQLNSGLKCRRPEEFAFIDQIVLMVNNLQLSEELVKSTFLWARRKKPYPFIYFERAIRERAAEGGVVIP
jgi:hypothetical protein